MRATKGFRFDGAELGARFEDVAIGGLTISPTGRIAMVQGNAAVRQAILLLLTTRPGERVMRPEYGCHIDRLLFSPNDATSAGLAIHYVRRAIQRWERRVEIVRLDAGPDRHHAAILLVTLEYRVRASGVVDTLTLPIDLERGARA